MSTICIECGDDDAAEGYPCCSDCLERVYGHGPDADARLAAAAAFGDQHGAHVQHRPLTTRGHTNE